jgi:hypothetical protein
VFDVHPPSTSIHGWRDFLVHLATITIGLLIALGLENSVEWFHHRHVMHQAQASLLIEIKSNSNSMQQKIASLEKHQQELKQDVGILDQIIAHADTPKNESLTVQLDINGFEDVSWNTAQSTGAVTYMPYSTAREYADIYGEQAEIDRQMREALRDWSIAAGPLLNAKLGDKPIDAEDAKFMKQHLGTLQGQLYMVDSLMLTMDEIYKKFLAAHPRAY